MAKGDKSKEPLSVPPSDGAPLQEALRAVEARYRLLAEHGTDVVWTTNANLRITYCSPSVIQLRGYTPEEAIKQSLREMVAPDSYEKAVEAFWSSVERYKQGLAEPIVSNTVELQHICKDGSTVWTETNSTFLFDENGEFAGLIGVTRDISARKNAEDALRESEAKYHEIFDSVGDGIAVTDLHGNFLDCNRAYCELLGYKREEIVGANLSSMMTPNESTRLRDLIKEVKRKGHLRWESVRETKDGRIVYVEIYTRLFTYGGRPAFLGVVRDITARRLAEEQFRESETKYRAIFDSVGDGIVVTTTDGIYLDANRAYCSMLGYTPDELIGTSVSAKMTPEEKKQFKPLLKQMATIGEVRYESVRVAKDGHLVYVDVYAREFTFGGQPAYLGVIRDITERKRAEEQLRESETKFRNIFHATADGIAVVDMDSRVMEANNAFCEILGWPSHVMLTSRLLDVIETGHEIVTEFLSSVVKIGEYRNEYVISLHEGFPPIAVEVYGKSYTHHNTPAVLVILRDVTERRRALEELRRRTERLETQHAKLKSATEQKASFFNSVSHELRTPMTSIIGFTELMLEDLDDPITPGQRELLMKVSQNSRRLLGMVNDLLDLSRLEARRVAPVIGEVDLRILTEQVVTNMNLLARDKDVELVVDYEGHSTVYTDEQKLAQILVNLVSNAIKFTPAGTITITSTATDSEIVCAVADTGVGIPRSERRAVFGEFYTGAGNGKNKIAGTGLGLAITKRLCELLGGKIKLTSEVGKGSTFTVRLPNRVGRVG